MVKTICKKVYDTENAEIVKKVTFGAFGEDDGYEETLYITSDGFYFLYVNGGPASIHAKEDIKRMSKANAEKWLGENA